MKTLSILSALLLGLSSCNKHMPRRNPAPGSDTDPVFIPSPSPSPDPSPDPDPDPDPAPDPAPDPGDDSGDDDPGSCSRNAHAGKTITWKTATNLSPVKPVR
jgi:hypothetical protein